MCALAGDMSGVHFLIVIPPSPVPFVNFMGDTFGKILVTGKPPALGPLPLSTPMAIALGPGSVKTKMMGRPVLTVGTLMQPLGNYTPAPIIGPGAPTVMVN
jgi:hypothetical protein